MIKISKTNDSTSCQACTETSSKEGSHDLYTVSFGYDGSNRIDSARFCSVCLADLGEKIKSVLKTEYDVTSPVLLLLRKLILCHPDEGSFEIEPEKKDEAKFWLHEHGYICEPSENGKRVHIEYWKKK